MSAPTSVSSHNWSPTVTHVLRLRVTKRIPSFNISVCGNLFHNIVESLLSRRKFVSQFPFCSCAVATSWGRLLDRYLCLLATHLLCLSSGSASFEGAFEGQLCHNAAWRLSQFEGSSRCSFFSLFLEDALLLSFVASLIPRFFALRKRRKKARKAHCCCCWCAYWAPTVLTFIRDTCCAFSFFFCQCYKGSCACKRSWKLKSAHGSSSLPQKTLLLKRLIFSPASNSVTMSHICTISICIYDRNAATRQSCVETW